MHVPNLFQISNLQYFMIIKKFFLPHAALSFCSHSFLCDGTKRYPCSLSTYSAVRQLFCAFISSTLRWPWGPTADCWAMISVWFRTLQQIENKLNYETYYMSSVHKWNLFLAANCYFQLIWWHLVYSYPYMCTSVDKS